MCCIILSVKRSHVRTVREHMFIFCCFQLNKRGSEGSLEIKMCMKIVLCEMITSLGWETHLYNITRSGTILFGCKIILTPEVGI